METYRIESTPPDAKLIIASEEVTRDGLTSSGFSGIIIEARKQGETTVFRAGGKQRQKFIHDGISHDGKMVEIKMDQFPRLMPATIYFLLPDGSTKKANTCRC